MVRRKRSYYPLTAFQAHMFNGLLSSGDELPTMSNPAFTMYQGLPEQMEQLSHVFFLPSFRREYSEKEGKRQDGRGVFP